jgi:hypothetical protein
LASENPVSTPSQWSKDFVEHLRTVHFTLIGISTALIVLVFSARLYNPEIALRQIHQILELKRIWSPEWAFDRSDIIRSVRTKEGVREGEQRPEGDFYQDVTLRSRNVFRASIEWPEHQSGHRANSEVTFNLPSRNFWETDARLPEVVPNTLDEFAYWWNGMFRGAEVKVPSELYTPVDRRQSEPKGACSSGIEVF